MGMNICVETLDSKEHPKWDYVRHAGDRDFIALARGLPAVENCEYIRPADFTSWRKLALQVEAESENVGRLTGLLDLLESEPAYWIRISY